MASVKQAFNNARKRINETQQKLTLDLYAGLTRVTPRDTGRHAASWRLTEDYIDSSVEPLGQGHYAVKVGRLPAPKSTLDIMYHITNNGPAIIPLNEGHSQQAGAHFVEQEIRAAKKRVSG